MYSTRTPEPRGGREWAGRLPRMGAPEEELRVEKELNSLFVQNGGGTWRRTAFESAIDESLSAEDRKAAFGSAISSRRTHAREDAGGRDRLSKQERITRLESIADEQRSELQLANAAMHQMREEFQQTWELTRMLQTSLSQQQARLEYLERHQAPHVESEGDTLVYRNKTTKSATDLQHFFGDDSERYLKLLAAVANGRTQLEESSKKHLSSDDVALSLLNSSIYTKDDKLNPPTARAASPNTHDASAAERHIHGSRENKQRETGKNSHKAAFFHDCCDKWLSD